MSTADATRLTALLRQVDRDELVQRIVSRLRERVPGYERLGDAALAGPISDVIRRNMELSYAWIVGGQVPGPADIGAFGGSAQRRAAEGMPLEDLLQAYRIGANETWAALRAVGTDEDARALLDAAERFMQYIDWVSAGITRSYLERRNESVSEGERDLRILLEAITKVRPLDAQARATAARLDLTLEAPLRAFAASLGSAGPLELARAAARLRELGVLALTEADQIVGLVPVEREPRLDGVGTTLAVVGDPAAREELEDQLAEIRRVHELARDLGMTGRMSLRGLALERVLARSRDVVAPLRDDVVATLLPHAGLITTLRAYLDAGRNRKAAALALHVHPNTLDYRLQRVADLTGLDVRETRDLVVIAMVLRYDDAWPRPDDTE